MIGTKVQRGLQEDDRITGEDALADAVAQALFNGRDEVLRHAAADGLVREDHLFGLGLRLEADIDVAELAVAAGLLLVTAVDLDLLLDGFTVGDLGGLEHSLDLVLALELGHQDGELHVASARDDEFLGFGVVAIGEGGVFLVQLDETGRDLILGALDLGVDGHLVHRLVVAHALDLDSLARHAEGIAVLDGGELGEDADVAAADLGGLSVVLALREEHVAELFRVAGADVLDGHGVLDVAGDDLEVGVLAVLVGHGVEDESHGAAVRVELEFRLFAIDDLGHGLALEGVRRELDEIGQQVRGAEAGIGAAAENGRDAPSTNAGLDAGEQLFFGERLFHEELLHEGFVGLGDLLVQLGHVFFDLVGRIGGQGDLFAGFVVRLLRDQVDHADSLVAVHDREREGDDGRAEHLTQRVEHIEEVGMLFVELGDVEHRGQAGLGEALPALFGADGDAALGGEADESCVRHAQRLRDLTGEVEIAGVVDKVQLALVIFHRNDGRGDGILSLLLFVVKVGNGRAVGAFAETGDRLGGEQHALAQGGLAVAAVSQQADVADVVGSIGHS